jgi:hypothetical protein
MGGSMPHLDMEYVMRRVVSLSVLGLTAGLLGGCDLKEVYPTAIPPLAGVRFINAVPDLSGVYGMDLRFVDILESNAHFRQAFRNLPTTASGITASAGVQFKHARAGTRTFKIFLDDTLQSVATTELTPPGGQTVVLNAGTNYTVIVWGYAVPGGAGRPAGALPMQISIIEESVADPGTNVAFRMINATSFALNGEAYTGANPTGTQTWTNVPPLSVTTHVTGATGTRRLAATLTAGGEAAFLRMAAITGAAASTTAPGSTILDIEALPGTSVAGSAVSYIVFPPSVTGISTVPQFSETLSGRRIATIEDLGGGTYRVNDCFAVAGCLSFAADGADAGTDPDTVASAAASNPQVNANGCVAGLLGAACTITITPAAGGPAAITVPVTANTNGTFTTTTDLSAYVGDYRPAIAALPLPTSGLPTALTWGYSVLARRAAVTSVWDRRPPYQNP